MSLTVCDGKAPCEPRDAAGRVVCAIIAPEGVPGAGPSPAAA